MSPVYQFSRAVVEVLSPSQSCCCLDESSKADPPPNKLLQLLGREKVTQTAVEHASFQAQQPGLPSKWVTFQKQSKGACVLRHRRQSFLLSSSLLLHNKVVSLPMTPRKAWIRKALWVSHNTKGSSQGLESGVCAEPSYRQMGQHDSSQSMKHCACEHTCMDASIVTSLCMQAHTHGCGYCDLSQSPDQS